MGMKEAIIQYNEEPGDCCTPMVISWKELVRCKDCKHRGDMHKCIVAFVASKQDFPVRFYDNDGNWFCADGRKKDE